MLVSYLSKMIGEGTVDNPFRSEILTAFSGTTMTIDGRSDRKKSGGFALTTIDASPDEISFLDSDNRFIRVNLNNKNKLKSKLPVIDFDILDEKDYAEIIKEKLIMIQKGLL